MNDNQDPTRMANQPALLALTIGVALIENVPEAG